MIRGVSLTILLAFGSVGCGGIVVFDNSGGAGSSSKSSAAAMKTTSTSVTASTGTSMCAGLGEVACLGSYPSCVPIYDDSCCSTCNPGTCADCVKYVFHHCAEKADACGKKPACGVVAPGDCNGTTTTCANQYCPANPGCVAGCTPDGMGGCSPECLPVTKGSCTIACAPPSPSCPPGYIPEANGGCYTGHCIVASTCPS